jgi:hypothetical protein
VSANELLKHVKALPRREREKLLLEVLKLDERVPDSKRKGKSIKWPDVQARAKRIFGNRIFPNLVMLEREERPY